MYQGKHHKRSHRRSGRSIALLVSILLIIGVAVGGAVAYLVDTDDPVENKFTPSQVATKVVEDITSNPTKKQAVKIQNTGDTDAWIRAAVVITWQDKDGNVYGQAPVKDTDYTITWGTGWLTGNDGFYYWPSPVAANGMTGDLIESISPKGNAPADGYYLTVEIIGSGIQSQPDEAVEQAWPAVEVVDGKLVAKTNSAG